MWLYQKVPWQSRARSKGDVNDIPITNIIEHNCCPPEGPQAGVSKLTKRAASKGSRAFRKLQLVLVLSGHALVFVGHLLV
jgi:hypothetical protein